MIEIKPTLLTGEVRLSSDSDGNVILLQNKQEVKLTLSQVKDVIGILQCVVNKVECVEDVE